MGIFKSYDIRGRYGEELSEKDAFLVGFYLVKLFKLKELKVAKDCRLSSEILTKFFILGVIESNCKIIYEGYNSTPCFYYSLFEGVNNGVIVTASHNPKEYNGFKIIIDLVGINGENGLRDLEKLVKEDQFCMELKFESLKEIYFTTPLKEVIEEFKGKNVEIVDYNNKYTKFLIKFSDGLFTESEKLKLKKLKIGIDYSNGMSSLAVIELNKYLGLNTFDYNYEPDGNFPEHEPDPLKISDYIKNIKTDLDFLCAFDGDGDRIAFFDENKEFIYSDYIIALFIEFFLQKNKGDKFCYDLRISRNVEDVIFENKAYGFKSRVGRSYLSNLMKDKDCFFGGELSGHLFFKEFNYYDNPDIAFIYFLKIVVEKIEEDSVVSELFNKYKKKYYKLKEINVKVDDANLTMEKIKKKYQEYLVDDLDGYSFNLNEVVWFNVRKSNTEPLLRFNIEGIDKEKVIKLKEDLFSL